VIVGEKEKERDNPKLLSLAAENERLREQIKLKNRLITELSFELSNVE
jgi:hypothetical protein